MGIRISQLSASQLPYTGREIIPMVQSSTTRSAPLSSLAGYLSGVLLSDAELAALSGNWQSTFTTVRSESADWESVYTSVASSSASWDAGGNILATVGDYLSTNNVLISSATISDTLFVPVKVVDINNTNKTFSVSDDCKIFHFNTSTKSLTATFPNSLPDGFNVAVMNTGTNVLRLSATTLYAVGQGISVQYGAAFVYKENGKIFAVGRL